VVRSGFRKQRNGVVPRTWIHSFAKCVPLGRAAKQEYLQSHPVQRRVGERGYDVFEETAHGDRITERTPTGDKHQDDLQGRTF